MPAIFAGFVPLLFNPHAWAALGLATMLAFSGGVVKGWRWSNADQARAYAAALERAVIDSAKISAADAEQAERDRADLVRVEATLESVLHENKKSAVAECRLTEPELRGLRKLASARR